MIYYFDTKRRLKFNEKIGYITIKVMEHHGLKGWDVAFLSSSVYSELFGGAEAAAFTNKKKKQIGFITDRWTSKSLVYVAQMVLHEVAHALAPAGTGHGPKWKKIVKKIGGIPSAVALDVR